MTTTPQIDRNQLSIKTRMNVEHIYTSNILYLEAYDNYCLIHLNDNSKRIVSKCLKYIQNALIAERFMRVHRKYAVNRDVIEDIDLKDSVVKLMGGIEVSISRAKRRKLKQDKTL